MTSDTVTTRVQRDTKSKIKKLSSEQGKSESEIIAQQFAETKTTPLSRGSGKEQGTIYISSATGNVYKSPKIDVNKLKELLQTPYIVSKLEKRSITYFPEKPRIEVYDPKQKLAPDETKIMQNMCDAPDVMFSDRIIQGDRDSFVYGMGAYNPVWVRKGGRVYLQKLRHFPAWSFDTAPSERSSYETWSPVLQGVILGADGTPEYWQRKNATTSDTELIDNIMIVKDPKDEGLAGDSDLIPLVSTIEMIKYVLNTEMQVISRAGAPIFFVKIINPRDADHPDCDGISDETFARMIIKDTSKDNSYVLRDNMEIQNVPFDPKKDNLATEATLKAIIDDYFSISNQISKNGTLIGGSAIPEFQLLLQAIKGRHTWLLAPFEQLLNQYFVLNGYPEGWTVKLSIQLWEEDKSELKLKQGDFAWKWGVALKDELRACAGLEPADKVTWAEIDKYYSNRVVRETAQFTHHQFTEEMDPVASEMKDRMDSAIDKLAKSITEGVMSSMEA